MKRTVCDVCGEGAVVTYNIKKLTAGFRPILVWAGPEMPGKYLDLCPEHDMLAPLLKSGEI